MAAWRAKAPATPSPTTTTSARFISASETYAHRQPETELPRCAGTHGGNRAQRGRVVGLDPPAAFRGADHARFIEASAAACLGFARRLRVAREARRDADRQLPAPLVILAGAHRRFGRADRADAAG